MRMRVGLQTRPVSSKLGVVEFAGVIQRAPQKVNIQIIFKV
jgi:hypothetical protein